MVGQLMRVKSEMHYESKRVGTWQSISTYISLVLINFPNVSKSDISCCQHQSSHKDHFQGENKNREPTKITLP